MAVPVSENSLPIQRASHSAEAPFNNVFSDDHDSSDEDDTVEDEGGGLDGDADSLVGFSISRTQAQMKLPATPASTKAQALESSRNYFESDLDQQDDSYPEDSPSGSAASKSQQSVQSPAISQQLGSTPTTAGQPSRSSFVSSILGGASTLSRARSGSGSSIVESIRKKLPGIPSISLPKFYGSSNEQANMCNPVGPRTVEDTRKATRNIGNTLQNHAKSTTDRTLGGNINGRPHAIRRATSDSSLYLKREVTRLSQFDDYNAFSNVSEMVNSRVKAITDSFQDSNLRLPKRSSKVISSGSRLVNDSQGQLPQMGDSNHPRFTQSDTMRSSKHPLLKHAVSRLAGDLVVMGGYRGSILREAQPPHRQLWVPIKVGMNLRKADLEVGLTREDEVNMHETIIPDGTLSHIGPVDISRRLLRKIKHCPNVRKEVLRLHDYGYDWRLSPDLLSDKMIEFLEQLPCNSSAVPVEQRGAWIIAHSLGGLITRHAINRRPELFAGVVYAGCPQNCVNILGPLRHGDDVLFSSRVLTAQVNFTLRTSYVLLPQDGRCFINKMTGERYNVDFFDPDSWNEYRLSPCIQEPLQREKQEKRSSIFGSLADAVAASKPSSWLGSFTGDHGSGSNTNEMNAPAEHSASTLHNAAKAAKPERPLSPTMQEGSSQAARGKPSIATHSSIPLPLAKAYLTHTLDVISTFKDRLHHLPELQDRDAYPPAGILFAKNTPTVYGAFVSSREAIKYDDAFDDLAFAAGDGVVLASAAQLPKGYLCVKNGRIESDRGHVGLLGDLEGVGRCLNAVIDARDKGVGFGAHRQEGKLG